MYEVCCLEEVSPPPFRVAALTSVGSGWVPQSSAQSGSGPCSRSRRSRTSLEVLLTLYHLRKTRAVAPDCPSSEDTPCYPSLASRVCKKGY